MIQQVITAVQASAAQGQAGTNATLTLINLIARGVSVTDPLVLQALADVKALLRGTVRL